MDPKTRLFATHGGSVVSLCRYAPGERQATHAHRHTSVTLVVRGSLEEGVEAETACGSALSAVVKPAEIEHRDTFGAQGAMTLQIVVSPGDERISTRHGAALSEWQWIHAGEVARELLGLLHVLMSPSGRRDGSPRDLGDRVYRALTSLRSSAAPRAGGAPDWLRRVQGTLASSAAPIRALAAEVGIHPVRLAREFRVHFGLAPSQYRRRARLGRAAGLIATSRVPLSEAALEAGYADQAHMTRELRALIGETPGGFRRLVAHL